MAKIISVECPKCQGKHLIPLPDGRGYTCPECDGVGFKSKKMSEPFWVLIKRRYLRWKYGQLLRHLYRFTNKRKLDRFLDDIIKNKEE